MAIGSTQFFQDYPDFYPRDEVVMEAVEKLKEFKALGGGAIIDCTTREKACTVSLRIKVVELRSRDSRGDPKLKVARVPPGSRRGTAKVALRS